MTTNNRSDIAIETAEVIETLLVDDQGLPGSSSQPHDGALKIVRTFIAATRVSQGPRVGRPRKPKAEG